jgi:hypothetical protein
METIDTFIKELEKKASLNNAKREARIAAPVIGRIIDRFKEMKQIHPGITRINYGMGSWSFSGTFEAVHEDEEGTFTADASELEYCIINAKVFVTEITDGMREIVALSDYLVDSSDSGLNYSTMLDQVDERGVIFYREVSPGSPFGHEPKADFIKSALYKQIVKLNIPHVIDASSY